MGALACMIYMLNLNDISGPSASHRAWRALCGSAVFLSFSKAAPSVQREKPCRCALNPPQMSVISRDFCAFLFSNKCNGSACILTQLSQLSCVGSSILLLFSHGEPSQGHSASSEAGGAV